MGSAGLPALHPVAQRGAAIDIEVRPGDIKLPRRAHCSRTTQETRPPRSHGDVLRAVRIVRPEYIEEAWKRVTAVVARLALRCTRG